MKTILFLGPVRNLTTLTSSILALHPDVVAYNHGIDSLPEHARFFDKPFTAAKMGNFLKYVADNYIYAGGFNGDIRRSHAFWHGRMNELQTVGSHTAEIPKAFLWKESGWLTPRVRECMPEFMTIYPDCIFLRPIRNPVHCALSHFKQMGYYYTYDYERAGVSRSPSFENFVDWYLYDLRWFVELSEKYPEKFYYFYEDCDIKDIINFLELEATPEWLETANKTFDVVAREKHQQLYDLFLDRIDKNLGSNPTFDQVLLKIKQLHLTSENDA